MKTIEKFQKMIDLLYVKGSMSPAKLSEILQADSRTITPMIRVAERLELISCEKLILSDRTYGEIDLTAAYREFLRQARKHGGKMIKLDE